MESKIDVESLANQRSATGVIEFEIPFNSEKKR